MKDRKSSRGIDCCVYIIVKILGLVMPYYPIVLNNLSVKHLLTAEGEAGTSK